jgi:ankyrin repeat protein
MVHHTDIVRALLDAGADASIRDSQFDSDAIGWAEFFRRTDIAQMLRDSKEEK